MWLKNNNNNYIVTNVEAILLVYDFTSFPTAVLKS